MKIAVMQPYIFPYIGYFQLMNYVDKFILYDDVTFIKRGWINRNKLLLNGNSFMFTVPIVNASQNTLIKDIKVAIDTRWKNKFYKTIEFAYKKTPFYNEIMSIICQVIDLRTKYLKDIHLISFELIVKYTGLETIIVDSSSVYNNDDLNGQNRIIDICIKEQATQYVNLYGGKKLYNHDEFNKKRLDLKFIKNNNQLIKRENKFSIIHDLMITKSSEMKNLYEDYTVVGNYN